MITTQLEGIQKTLKIPNFEASFIYSTMFFSQI